VEKETVEFVRKRIEQAMLYWDRMNEWAGVVPTREDVVQKATEFVVEDTNMSWEKARQLVEKVYGGE